MKVWPGRQALLQLEHASPAVQPLLLSLLPASEVILSAENSPVCHTSKMFSSASWRWSWQSHDRLLMLGSEAVASVPASTCRQLFSAERRPQEAPGCSVFLHLSLFSVQRVKLCCCVQVDYGPGAENATKIPVRKKFRRGIQILD